jgi:serine/threonine protein kinase
MYPGCGDDSLDLLNKILQFNPHFRISVDECLSHPFLSKVRKEEKEIFVVEKVKLEFEKETEISIEMLRTLFIEEIEHFTSLKSAK